MQLCEFSFGSCVHCGAAKFSDRQVCGSGKKTLRQPPQGPGTELSKLLGRFGIEPTPTCPCREMAARMDAWGCDEASRPERVDEVVAVMRSEAAARGLPFVDAVGRMLVKRAIRTARRNQPTPSGPTR